jgi:hypothetical protein
MKSKTYSDINVSESEKSGNCPMASKPSEGWKLCSTEFWVVEKARNYTYRNLSQIQRQNRTWSCFPLIPILTSQLEEVDDVSVMPHQGVRGQKLLLKGRIYMSPHQGSTNKQLKALFLVECSNIVSRGDISEALIPCAKPLHIISRM